MEDDTVIANFDKKDAFDEATGGKKEEKVHIRLQQRNRKKFILTITGLADDLDLKRICKALKKTFKCNGAVVKDEEYGEVIQLQGDHRQGVVEFLTEEEIVDKENIVVHGF